MPLLDLRQLILEKLEAPESSRRIKLLLPRRRLAAVGESLYSIQNIFAKLFDALNWLRRCLRCHQSRNFALGKLGVRSPLLKLRSMLSKHTQVFRFPILRLPGHPPKMLFFKLKYSDFFLLEKGDHPIQAGLIAMLRRRFPVPRYGPECSAGQELAKDERDKED